MGHKEESFQDPKKHDDKEFWNRPSEWQGPTYEMAAAAYLEKEAMKENKKYDLDKIKAMKNLSAAEILNAMAKTFQERNAEYGDNYLMVAPIMNILFPTQEKMLAVVRRDDYHLLELIVVKLTRFAVSAMDHKDSIHDVGVYAAMIEMILTKEKKA